MGVGGQENNKAVSQDFSISNWMNSCETKGDGDDLGKKRLVGLRIG